jgi:ankyrin repeat protein
VLACKNNNLEIVKLLFNQPTACTYYDRVLFNETFRENTSRIPPVFPFDFLTPSPYSPLGFLKEACKNQNKEIVSFFLNHEHQAKIGLQIYYLFRCNSKDEINFLVTNCTNSETINIMVISALLSQSTDGLKILSDKFPDETKKLLTQNFKGSSSAFLYACQYLDSEMVEFLHSMKDELQIDLSDTKTEAKATALTCACLANNEKTIDFLLNNGADITAVDQNENNIIMHLSSNYSVYADTFEFLLEKNDIDLNKTNNNGETALILACKQIHIKKYHFYSKK